MALHPPPFQAHSVGNGDKVLGLKWQRYKTDLQHPLGTEFENVKKGKVHPFTGTEALYRPYGP